MARAIHQRFEARSVGTSLSISRARRAWAKQVRHLVLRVGWDGGRRERRGGYWELVMRVDFQNAERGRARCPQRAVLASRALGHSRPAEDSGPYLRVASPRISFARAFTLVELLVVITVIAVLTGVMVAEMG